jgi:esterase/lipase
MILMKTNANRTILALLLFLLLIPACSPAGEERTTPTPVPTATETPTPILAPTATRTPRPTPYPFEAVSFTTTDDVTLSGRLFGTGEVAVILAHQGTPGADQDTWQSFAGLLAEDGFTALTLDFRGVGESGGSLNYANLGMDVEAAAGFLRERGYTRIACAGASMGGTACIRAAQSNDFIGLIILASTMRTGGNPSLSLSHDELAGLDIPKLFITAENDNHMVINDIRTMYDLSPEPKQLLALPGSRHGTFLFATDAGPALTDAMLTFLEGLR